MKLTRILSLILALLTVTSLLCACKPDDDIFEKLLAAEGINAEDCLFLDDSRDNCATAASMGIASLLMERNAALPQWLIE